MNELSRDVLANRPLPPDCLSDLTLDRLRLADLTAEAADGAERHLESCERCRQRAASLAAQSERAENELPDLDALLGARAPAQAEAAHVERTSNVASLAKSRKRPKRWWAPALAVLSAAAAIALFLRQPERAEGEIRLKGVSGELDVFVKRDGKVFRWQTESLRPGDQLRYSFRAPEPLHVMMLSREASGAVNQYFPAESSSFAVPMGVTLSKSATELDATLGGETVWAVFCRTPFTAQALISQLESTSTIAPAEGCATQRLEFTKVTP